MPARVPGQRVVIPKHLPRDPNAHRGGGNQLTTQAAYGLRGAGSHRFHCPTFHRDVGTESLLGAKGI